MKSQWLACAAFLVVLLGASVAGTVFRLPIWQTGLIAAVLIGLIGAALTRLMKP